MNLVPILLLATNVMFIHNGEVKVGEVVKSSYGVTYVIDCERYDPLHRMQIPNHEIIAKVRTTCAEFRELKKDLR